MLRCRHGGVLKLPTNPWFRLYRQTISNPKVQKLSPELFKFWINCLCLTDDDGTLPSLEDICYGVRLSAQKVQDNLNLLNKANLVNYATDGDSTFCEVNCWREWQPRSDNAAERMRNNRRTRSEHVPNMNRTSSEGVRLEQNRTEQNREEQNIAHLPPVDDAPFDPVGTSSGNTWELEPTPVLAKKPDLTAEWFLVFWKAYSPVRSKSKKATESAFKRKVKTLSAFESVMAGLDRQMEGLMGKEPQYRPHGSTWLNGERWNDGVEQAQSAGSYKPKVYLEPGQRPFRPEDLE